MTYNVYNQFSKLKTVMLGTCHPPEFFDNVKESKIREPLKRIVDESLEELDYFESVLKQFGCKVLRCPTIYDYETTESFKRYDAYVNARNVVPRNSLMPRDCQLVLGNKLVVSGVDNKGILQTCRDYNSKDIVVDPKMLHDFISDETDKDQGWPAPCVTVVGDRVYYDSTEINLKYAGWLKEKFPQFKWISVDVGGHNDGCFATLKPGVLMSLHNIQKYEETFPGWDILYLPDQDFTGSDFIKIKEATEGKWWIPGEESNQQLIKFVNTWLDDWVGYVEETVFDVNVLVLDEHHVCVTNPNNQEVNNFFKKHKIEPVHIPWTHRYFWDGGLHCLTLDIEREGNMENYF